MHIFYKTKCCNIVWIISLMYLESIKKLEFTLNQFLKGVLMFLCFWIR